MIRELAETLWHSLESKRILTILEGEIVILTAQRTGRDSDRENKSNKRGVHYDKWDF